MTEVPPEHSIQALKGVHAGATAWIVGKGPSLLMLTREQLGPGPIIAINEATIVVESLGLDNPVYSMQKDADSYAIGPDGPLVTGGAAPIASLRGATLLVHQHESANRMSTYAPRFVFDNVKDFGLEWWEFSSLTAVAIAKLLGCVKVVFVSHDSSVFGDTRTCQAMPDGWFQVYSDAEASVAYTDYRRRIDNYLTRISMDAEWFTPESDYSRRRTADLVAKVDRLTAQLEQSRAISHALSAGHVVLRAELDVALAEMRSTTAALARTEQKVGSMLGSTSWRWTAPFRAARDLLARTIQRQPGT